MSDQFKVAFVRALIIAFVTSLSTGLTTWATTDELKTILIAAGAAFSATFLSRFVGEGAYDTQRA